MGGSKGAYVSEGQLCHARREMHMHNASGRERENNLSRTNFEHKLRPVLS